MARLDKIAKQTTKPVDDYLKFVEQNFNTSNTDFEDIVKQLDAFSQSSLIFSRQQRGALERARIAKKLRKQLKKITILEDFDKYKKFDKLGNFDFSAKGLKEVYRVSEDIIKDINTARQWLDSYRAYEHILNQLSTNETVSTEDLMKQLLVVGKSILGRAIELTPMLTGTLRRSGIMLEFEDYIIIAFTAPYAMYVHERMDIIHPIHNGRDCGGDHKFLENAVQDFFPEAQVIINHLDIGAVAVKINVYDLIR